jgi:hypothetical protein
MIRETSCFIGWIWMSWIWTRASETPNRPIMIATKWMPLMSPMLPKVNLPWAVKVSIPIMLSQTPRAPAKTPLARESLARLPTRRSPMIASRK